VRTNLLKKELEHRWVPPDNYHCTLNFLGETNPDLLPELSSVLKAVSERHKAFDLKVHGIDAFPEIEEGRVIYVGIQNSRELRALQEDCLENLRNTFHPEERPYVPHLTIARLRNPKNLKDLLSPLKNQNFGTLNVPELVLYESVSGGAFPVYKPIEKFPLNGP
jgi:RNA 2',3'-cyclic 3'-phosphodiesterase